MTVLGDGEQLVTGEAVALDLRPASFATRGLAFALDAAVQGVALVALAYIFGNAVGSWSSQAQQAAVVIAGALVIVGLPVLVETFTRGRSLGKLAGGLRVVRSDGGPISFRHALTRWMVAVLEIYAVSGSIALLSSLTNRRGQRIGDLAAGTFVVRERSGPRAGRRAQMPPELADWASRADIGQLPDDLALGMRRFVGGDRLLHPQAYHDLSTQLAREASRYVRPLPPPTTAPDRFIHAVLVERYRRDLARLRDSERQRR